MKKDNCCEVLADGLKYIIIPCSGVREVIPFPTAGRLIYKGKEMLEEFPVQEGEKLEFYPLSSTGKLSWELKVWEDGSKAVALVQHERAGQYVLSTTIPGEKTIYLEKYITWENAALNLFPDLQEAFRKELENRGIKAGLKPDIWKKILDINGPGEVLVAEKREPVPPIHALLEDYNSAYEQTGNNQQVDFFVPSLITCNPGDIIARKIPGMEGTPGTNIFGQPIPPEPRQDFELKAKKNCTVSEDGLEVKADCAGAPMRSVNYTYSVENLLVVPGDVDLEYGSIDYPGDIIVNKNVHEGLKVYSNGRIEIKGSVSGADLKAESSIYIHDNIFNSNLILGQKHIFRSSFISHLENLKEDLVLLIKKSNNYKKLNIDHMHYSYGQVLNVLIEREYPTIRRKILILSKMINDTEDENLFNRNIITAIHTLNYFLTGSSVSELKDEEYLVKSLQIIQDYLRFKETYTQDKKLCVVGYVQNSTVNCFGDFICLKDAYGSDIKAKGEIKVMGTCRGSKLTSNKKVSVLELGSTAGEDTLVKIPREGILTAEFCHPNVRIIIGSEEIFIDQPIKKLDVYYENKTLFVDKLNWHDYDGTSEITETR